ncbi:hypothetical protein BV898_17215 [Hypsibius exemplaris]|uniref:Uncharacterized protein n=1 Tax=Hypsibius exemplaris TaxID=2072580 RepID=A0A9X6NEY6_HYPEX|nr:hypothetical protein BV898_17215 [Hypsibius exemplaris]
MSALQQQTLRHSEETGMSSAPADQPALVAATPSATAGQISISPNKLTSVELPEDQSSDKLDDQKTTRRQKRKLKSQPPKKPHRKRSALGHQKKHKELPCGVCCSGKRADRIVPCSLFDTCKNWICRECCLEHHIYEWLSERKNSTTYDQRNSPYFIICRNDE